MKCNFGKIYLYSLNNFINDFVLNSRFFFHLLHIRSEQGHVVDDLTAHTERTYVVGLTAHTEPGHVVEDLAVHTKPGHVVEDLTS